MLILGGLPMVSNDARRLLTELQHQLFVPKAPVQSVFGVRRLSPSRDRAESRPEAASGRACLAREDELAAIELRLDTTRLTSKASTFGGLESAKLPEHAF